MSNELFDVFLYLRSKLLIVTDQQFQQLTNEPRFIIIIIISTIIIIIIMNTALSSTLSPHTF